jgi:hypothetical protein
MLIQGPCRAVLGSGHRCASLVDSAYDVSLTGLDVGTSAIASAATRSVESALDVATRRRQTALSVRRAVAAEGYDDGYRPLHKPALTREL